MTDSERAKLYGWVYFSSLGAMIAAGYLVLVLFLHFHRLQKDTNAFAAAQKSVRGPSINRTLDH